MAIEVRSTIYNLSPLPDVGFQYQENGLPWPSVSAAHYGVAEAYRADGKIRFIDSGDGRGKIEYWYNGGIELNHLKPRFENLESAQAYVTELNAIKDETQALKEQVLDYVGMSMSEYEDKGPWDVVANEPELSADSSVGQTGEKGQKITVTVGGPVQFAGVNFESGDIFTEGDQLFQFSNDQWYRVPFKLTGYVKNADFSSVEQKVSQTITLGSNLIDKTKLVLGTYYATSGGILSNPARRRVADLIPVKPNQSYKIQGINTDFVGAMYEAEPASGANFEGMIGTNEGIKSEFVFTTGPNVHFVGINVDSSALVNSTETAMLYEYDGENKDYERHGVFFDVSKIVDPIPGVTYNADFNPVKARTEAVTKVSENLINTDELVPFSAFSNQTGLTGASTSGKRTGLIPVVPNAPMYLQGVMANVLGGIYSSDGTRLRKIAEPFPNNATVTEYAFNTGTGAAFVGINISNQEHRTPGAFDNTAMLSYGATKKKYAPHGTFVPYNKVGAGPIPNSELYYSFDFATLTWSVFCQYPKKADLFFAFLIKRVTDPLIRQDVWRITGGQLHACTEGVMTNLNKSVLHTLENEYVYQQTGKADHVGGYHGDEVLDDVTFFVDDLPIVIPTANIDLTACKKFQYRQSSKMYEMEATPSTPGTVQAQHIKISSFTKGEFTTRNTLKWDAALPIGGIDIALGYVGLLCVGPATAAKIYSKRSTSVWTATGASAFLFNENAGSNELFYFNETEKLSASVSSRINAIIENGIDKTADYNNAANLICWDRNTDRKYYRRFSAKKAFPNDVWDVELHFAFNGI